MQVNKQSSYLWYFIKFNLKQSLGELQIKTA
jgi:hypothetical protein